MKLVCAWCGVAIDHPEYNRNLDCETSHGMCSDCSQALAVQDRGTSLQQHLNTIPIPVLVIDDSYAVVIMNTRAWGILGKSLDDKGTELLGRVFDCVYSRTPEGCGRMIHCTGCTIRRSVTRTFDTGEPQVSVPATLSIASLDHISEAVLAVTTVKIGQFILLRID